MDYTEEELASLEPAEREALLNEPDGGTTATLGESLDTNTDENKDNTDVDTGTGTGEEGGAAGGADTNTDPAAGGTDGDGQGADPAGNGDGTGTGGDADDSTDAATAPADAPAPLLVADMPENADGKLKDITDRKGTLLEQHENGDITTREYHEQMESLNKEQRDLERAIDKATTAAEMAQQQQVNTWMAQVKDFTSKAHPEYSKSQLRYAALDQMVRQVGNDPANASLSGPAILAKAHALVVADLGAVPGTTTPRVDPGKGEVKGKDGKDLNAAGRPLKGSKAEQPKTLRDVPAAAPNDTNSKAGEWAALDRLQESNPEAHEDRMMRMSESERDAYLSYRG